MNLHHALYSKRLFGFLMLVGLFFGALTCLAQPNSWTSSVSGNWQDSTWSLGVPPAASQSVLITNAGFKAVGIFPATVANFPATMTVSNLTVSAPSNSENTLLLNFFGTAVPLEVLSNCMIASNGTTLNLFSGLQVDGELLITNGNFVQEGGVTVATNGFLSVAGSLEITNAALSFGTAFLITNTSFVQSGGNVSGSNLLIQSGTFELDGGLLSATLTVGSFGGIGTFTQNAGTNRGNIILGNGEVDFGGDGYYVLNGGRVESPQLTVGSFSPSSGIFTQNGGTVTNQSLQLGISEESSFGDYKLLGGVLMSGSVSINNGGFLQSNGVHTAGGISIFGFIDEDYGLISVASYSLEGGFLTCRGLSIGFGGMDQDSGTNTVAGDLSISGGSYYLGGGLLSVSNAIIGPGELIEPAAFSVGNGTLFAPNIVVAVGASFNIGPAPAGAISNATSFVMNGGAIYLNDTTQRLASMTLSGNSAINFGPGASQLTFANSSDQAWTNGVTLTVSNWSGSALGDGTNKLIFGNAVNGLTAAQLQQIQFINPAGFGPGTWPAKILSTGEIVPTAVLPLSVSARGNSIIVQWPGNYVLQAATNLPGPFQDILASSPYTNNTTQFPQRFFRLRQ